MNTMVLSDPWDVSLDTIALHPGKLIQGMNAMRFSEPWINSLGMINLKLLKNY